MRLLVLFLAFAISLPIACSKRSHRIGFNKTQFAGPTDKKIKNDEELTKFIGECKLSCLCLQDTLQFLVEKRAASIFLVQTYDLSIGTRDSKEVDYKFTPLKDPKLLASAFLKDSKSKLGAKLRKEDSWGRDLPQSPLVGRFFAGIDQDECESISFTTEEKVDDKIESKTTKFNISAATKGTSSMKITLISESGSERRDYLMRSDGYIEITEHSQLTEPICGVAPTADQIVKETYVVAWEPSSNSVRLAKGFASLLKDSLTNPPLEIDVEAMAKRDQDEATRLEEERKKKEAEKNGEKPPDIPVKIKSGRGAGGTTLEIRPATFGIVLSEIELKNLKKELICE